MVLHGLELLQHYLVWNRARNYLGAHPQIFLGQFRHPRLLQLAMQLIIWDHLALMVIRTRLVLSFLAVDALVLTYLTVVHAPLTIAIG
jgi:hypothetical protein